MYFLDNPAKYEYETFNYGVFLILSCNIHFKLFYQDFIFFINYGKGT